MKNSWPVFLNADHTYSFDRVKEVIDAGFDSAIFDGAALSYDENVAITKQCVDYARQKSKETGRDIVVEAEMGFIGRSSEIHDTLPEGVGFTEEYLTKVDMAKSFIAATGADMFAPAIGNMHGLLKSGPKPALNIQRIADISKAVGIPLVLHGGSGDSQSDLIKAIDAGIGIVHINTELTGGLPRRPQSSPYRIIPTKSLRINFQSPPFKPCKRLWKKNSRSLIN